MRRDAVPIKSHVQVEEKVEKSDLKASDKILQKNPSGSGKNQREGLQRGAINLKHFRLDGMVEDILCHWQKSKHCQKVSVVIYHRVI